MWLGATGCRGKDTPEDDQRLAAALKAGRWPASEGRTEPSGQPQRLDPDRYREVLGSFRYEATVRYAYHGAAGPESQLAERTRLTMASDGRFQLSVQRDFQRVDDPAGKSGREAIWDGKRFYTRTGQGRWLAWDPLRRGQDGWLRTSTKHLEVALKMAAPGLVREARGKRIELSLGKVWKTPRLPEGTSMTEARLSETDVWYRWWGRTHRPTRLTGFVERHAKHPDLIMSATLAIDARTTKMKRPRSVLSQPEVRGGPNPFGRSAKPPDERIEATPPPPTEKAGRAPATLRTSTTVTITALETEPKIEAPAPSSVHDGRRKRVHHMITSLLGPVESP